MSLSITKTEKSNNTSNVTIKKGSDILFCVSNNIIFKLRLFAAVLGHLINNMMNYINNIILTQYKPFM